MELVTTAFCTNRDRSEKFAVKAQFHCLLRQLGLVSREASVHDQIGCSGVSDYMVQSTDHV